MKRLLIIATLCILLVAAGSTAVVSAASARKVGAGNAGKPDERSYYIGLDWPVLVHILGKLTVNVKTGDYKVAVDARTWGLGGKTVTIVALSPKAEANHEKMTEFVIGRGTVNKDGKLNVDGTLTRDQLAFWNSHPDIGCVLVPRLTQTGHMR